MLARRLLVAAAGGAGFTQPVGGFGIPAPNAGGWTEVLGPHAVRDNERTYIGWTGGNSKPKDIEVVAFDHALSTLEGPTLLHHALSDGVESAPDSHEGPGLLVLPDGKILAAYMGHGAGSFRTRRTVSAGDISAWTTEVVKSPIAGLLTYAQVSYCSSNDRCWITYRQESGGQSYQVRSHSDDHGDTWANGSQFWQSNHANHYSAFASDGVSRIHYATTDDNPNAGGYGLYYFQMDTATGNLYAADGTTLLASSASLPAEPSDVTQLHDGSGDEYPYSLSFTADGRPVIACQSKFADPVEIFEYRWSGSAWVRHAITTSDPISPSILSVGGGLHVWGDASRFITSRMSGGELVVSEYRSADDGATWAWFADYGSGSSPVYVRDGDGLVALWFAPASSFTGSHDFDPGLAGTA